MVLGASIRTLGESDCRGDGDGDGNCSLADGRWVRAVTGEGLDNNNDRLGDDWVRVLVVMVTVMMTLCLVRGSGGLLP